MRRWPILLLLLLELLVPPPGLSAAETVTCWFPPAWKEQPNRAEVIARALSAGAAIQVRARIADDYGQILTAFSGNGQHLVYAGSFVQAIITARKLGSPLLQTIDGDEMYSGILVVPAGVDPQDILQRYPARIAYAVGTSSGESSAKAATGGRAALGVASHGAAIASLLAGEAKGAMVKNRWWEQRKSNHPGLVAHALPGISIPLHPDNILAVSKSVPEATCSQLRQAALSHAASFSPGASLQPFDPAQLSFTLGLMHKGKIDPLTYSW